MLGTLLLLLKLGWFSKSLWHISDRICLCFNMSSSLIYLLASDKLNGETSWQSNLDIMLVLDDLRFVLKECPLNPDSTTNRSVGVSYTKYVRGNKMLSLHPCKRI